MSETVKVIRTSELIDCACGCGQKRPRFDNRGKERRFILYHHAKMEKSWTWGDGTKLTSMGYRKVMKPDYYRPSCDGYVLEHRLVYEEYYKCCLLPWGVVHHLNIHNLSVWENKHDNSIENLEGMTGGQHTALESKVDMSNRKCSCCGSKESHNNDNGNIIWYKDGKNGFLCSKCYRRSKRKNM